MLIFHIPHSNNNLACLGTMMMRVNCKRGKGKFEPNKSTKRHPSIHKNYYFFRLNEPCKIFTTVFHVRSPAKIKIMEAHIIKILLFLFNSRLFYFFQLYFICGYYYIVKIFYPSHHSIF